MDSGLILNQAAYKSLRKNGRPLEGNVLTIRDIFRNLRLRAPSLATIIGYGSEISSISSTDDVQGIPGSLFYAGVSAVVSTLWPIDDDGGASFAEAFYSALTEQRLHARSTENKRPAAGEQAPPDDIDLASAMQSAVKQLWKKQTDATGSEKKRDPYHWAAFVLSGFWMLPAAIVDPEKTTTADNGGKVPDPLRRSGNRA